MEIGNGYLEREERADAIAEDVMERQEYEKHIADYIALLGSAYRQQPNIMSNYRGSTKS